MLKTLAESRRSTIGLVHGSVLLNPMAFKPISSGSVSLDSPQGMFADIRGKKVQGLLAQQSEVLTSYSRTAAAAKDVAIKMSTGAGKTLVGLLLCEWRRRKDKHRVVYLCPTRQLVHQVVDQARNFYGLNAHGFTGSKADYDRAASADYRASDAIAVTNYSSLFNVAPFFNDAQTIVLDDAHAAEQYISDMWSVRLRRHDEEEKAAFAQLVGVIKPHVSDSDKLRLEQGAAQNWDRGWVDVLPGPLLNEIAKEVVAVLDVVCGAGKMQARFTWGMVRNYLHACQLYWSADEILIRPIISPTHTHVPFENAEQRIYMSATLGEDGDMERVTGRRSIVRLPEPTGSEKRLVGRRFFIFPERGLTEAEAEQFYVTAARRAGRTVVLVPDGAAAAKFSGLVKQRLDFPVYNAAQIEQSKREFVDSKSAVAILAGRYDGIDFPDDQCRLLIVSGLPSAISLQERLFVVRFGAIRALDDRIRTRIVQAFGRCTRNANDYAAVVVLGADLESYVQRHETRGALHPELQAEVHFGIEQSKAASLKDQNDNFDAFLAQGEAWAPAENSIIELRDNARSTPMPGVAELAAAAPYEIDFQRELWKGDFNGAVAAARRVVAELRDSTLTGYRALWHYFAGCAAHLGVARALIGDAGIAAEQFRMARRLTKGIPWLSALVAQHKPGNEQDEMPDTGAMLLVQRIEERLQDLKLVHDIRFNQQERQIRDLLNGKSQVFEQGFVELGAHLGFLAERPGTDGAPDGWWICPGVVAFVFEHYSDALPTSKLSLGKIRQLLSHEAWLTTHVPEAKGIPVVPVMVAPVTLAENDTRHLWDKFAHWPVSEFSIWAEMVLGAVRELRKDFPGPGDMAWRADAASRLEAGALSPAHIRLYLEDRTAVKVLKVGPA